jgi:hypothetical protein
MCERAEETDAGRHYATAYDAHYLTRDLHQALDLYRDVMAMHPNTQEAKYARAQIHRIVNRVVPRQVLLDAQVELALVHLGRAASLEAARGVEK